MIPKMDHQFKDRDEFKATIQKFKDAGIPVSFIGGYDRKTNRIVQLMVIDYDLMLDDKPKHRRRKNKEKLYVVDSTKKSV